MLRTILLPGLLAMSLAAPVARAQAAPSATAAPAATPAPAANPVDPAAVQALRDMGAYLQSLKRFHVATVVTGERVLADGQKLQHTATAGIDVLRPNKLRAVMRNAAAERVISYDGKTVTLYAPAPKYYSTVELDVTIGELVDRLEQKYGVEIPLSDLFLFGTPLAPLDKFESAMNAGQDVIGGDLCDHYAFRQARVDWQIWISASGQPLPRKVVVTSRGDDARPQSVSLIDWNLKPAFQDTVFKFTPPKGATKVEIVPRKTP
jgi:hypothetical protein